VKTKPLSVYTQCLHLTQTGKVFPPFCQAYACGSLSSPKIVTGCEPKYFFPVLYLDQPENSSMHVIIRINIFIKPTETDAKKVIKSSPQSLIDSDKFASPQSTHFEKQNLRKISQVLMRSQNKRSI